MTSCDMLGMRTMLPARREQMTEMEDVASPFKKQKRLMKSIHTQVTSLTRLVILLILIEFIRMVKA